MAVRWLRNAFQNPSGYIQDPIKYAWNQTGHFCLGYVLADLAGPVVALLGYAAWEIAQVLFAKAKRWDSLEDMAFVTLGVLAASLSGWFVLPALGMLCIGAYLRS